VTHSMLLALTSLAFTGIASAQTAPLPSSPPGAPPPSPAGSDVSTWVIAALFVGLVLALAIAVKIVDLRRRRADESVALQARLADALLVDRSLIGATVTPTVHVPMSRSAPIVLEVAGDVPSPELKDLVLQRVKQEVSPTGARPIQIQDRLLVRSPIFPRAA
jgi:hypothetical protein